MAGILQGPRREASCLSRPRLVALILLKLSGSCSKSASVPPWTGGAWGGSVAQQQLREGGRAMCAGEPQSELDRLLDIDRWARWLMATQLAWAAIGFVAGLLVLLLSELALGWN